MPDIPPQSETVPAHESPSDPARTSDDLHQPQSTRFVKLLKHLKRYHQTYGLAGVVFALAISGLSVWISHKSVEVSARALQFTAKSLRLQEDAFRIHNRPYIFLERIGFGGPGVSVFGHDYPYTLATVFRNASDIPATYSALNVAVLVDGRLVGPSWARGSGIFAPQQVLTTAAYFLESNLYTTATSTAHTFQAYIQTTYLGVSPNEGPYTNEIVSAYDSQRQLFMTALVETNDPNRALWSNSPFAGQIR